MRTSYQPRNQDRILLTAIDDQMKCFIITIHSKSDKNASLGVALSLHDLKDFLDEVTFAVKSLTPPA